MAASSRPIEWRHFIEVNSGNIGGGHVCWGSYDGFNFAGWRGCYDRDRVTQRQTYYETDRQTDWYSWDNRPSSSSRSSAVRSRRPHNQLTAEPRPDNIPSVQPSTLRLKKCYTYAMLWLTYTWTNFDNFWQNVNILKLSMKKCQIFPPHLTSSAALIG